MMKSKDKLNNSWYTRAKRSTAMALEPNMWETDPNPHRQPEHSPSVWTPYGAIMQKQDRAVVKELYEGVHLTDSIELAAIYANNKSTESDPPVVIEIYGEDFERTPDVDAYDAEESVRTVVGEKRPELEKILRQKTDSDTKVDRIIDVFRNGYYDGESLAEEPIDLLIENSQSSADGAIVSHFESFQDADSALQEIQKMISGYVPEKILIIIANQFRVFSSIGDEKVHAIFEVNRVNLNKYAEIYNYETMTDEELKEDGVVRIGKEYYDEDGRQLMSQEDVVENSWLAKKALYIDTKGAKGVEGFTYHGTSLSRAKNAYPNLLK